MEHNLLAQSWSEDKAPSKDAENQHEPSQVVKLFKVCTSFIDAIDKTRDKQNYSAPPEEAQ